MSEPPESIPPRVQVLNAYWHHLVVPMARGLRTASWHVLWFSILVKLFLFCR